jgi:hypothetical protein
LWRAQAGRADMEEAMATLEGIAVGSLFLAFLARRFFRWE